MSDLRPTLSPAAQATLDEMSALMWRLATLQEAERVRTAAEDAAHAESRQAPVKRLAAR